MQACSSSFQSFGMTTCCGISSHVLAFTPVSNQLSDIYAQVSFINFRLLSSGTPLHTSTLQKLHFTDVLAVAAHGFCSWGNIIELRFWWVFPDVVAVRVSGGCTNGTCGVLTDNASFVKTSVTNVNGRIYFSQWTLCWKRKHWLCFAKVHWSKFLSWLSWRWWDSLVEG